MQENELTALINPAKLNSQEITSVSTFDYTADLVGQRTLELLSSNSELENGLSTFKSIAPITEDEKPVLFAVPGLVVSSSSTFIAQKGLIRNSGYDLMHFDYSQKSFSRDLIKAQILDVFDSPLLENKKISLLGLSLGSGILIDALSQLDDKNLSKLKSVMLLGTVYSDDDLKYGVFGKSFRLANRLTPDVIASRFAPLAKRLFSLDPAHPDFVESEILEVPNHTLIERIRSVGKTETDKKIKPLSVPVSIGWWEDDFSSSDAQERIQSLFPNSTTFKIPGHHAWTVSGSYAINVELGKILN